jgi:transcription elongation factor GreA
LSNDRVHFGSTVTLLNLDTDETEVYTICGVLESEPENGLISIHAPLSKVMMGKRVEDEFILRLPKGKKEYEIERITYIPIFDLKKNIRTIKDYSIK